MRKSDIDLIVYLLLWTLTTACIFLWMIAP